MPRYRRLMICLGAAFVGLAGCRKAEPPPPPPPPAPFQVTGVDVGRGVNPDKSILGPTLMFAPLDTVYASVATAGIARDVKLRARFIFETGQLLHEFVEPVTANGPAHAEFHLWRAAGWPEGRYRVEVFIDTLPAGYRQYEVRK
jgi:hypothetical protein